MKKIAKFNKILNQLLIRKYSIRQARLTKKEEGKIPFIPFIHKNTKRIENYEQN